MTRDNYEGHKIIGVARRSMFSGGVDHIYWVNDRDRDLLKFEISEVTRSCFHHTEYFTVVSRDAAKLIEKGVVIRGEDE